MASNNWGAYSVIFLAAGAAMLLPLGLEAVSALVRQGRPEESKGALKPSLSGDEQRLVSATERMNTRYFLGINIAMLVAFGLLVLIPLMSFSREKAAGRSDLFFGVLGILATLFWAGLSLAYAVRKGDLDWLRHYSKEGKKQ
jgi:NADH:ubiquinone oxidoreductase subunit 3 (subunit A)